MKNIEETRNYFVEETEQTELMSRKHKKVKTLKYIEHFLILASTIIGCIPISVFASFLGVPIGITIFAIGLKICTIAQELRYISQ